MKTALDYITTARAPQQEQLLLDYRDYESVRKFFGRYGFSPIGDEDDDYVFTTGGSTPILICCSRLFVQPFIDTNDFRDCAKFKFKKPLYNIEDCPPAQSVSLQEQNSATASAVMTAVMQYVNKLKQVLAQGVTVGQQHFKFQMVEEEGHDRDTYVLVPSSTKKRIVRIEPFYDDGIIAITTPLKHYQMEVKEDLSALDRIAIINSKKFTKLIATAVSQLEKTESVLSFLRSML